MIDKLLKLLKRIIKGVFSRINTEYTIVCLYPRLYKKYSKLPVDEKKVIFIESRLPELTNSFHVIYDTLYAETDFELKCHFLRKTFVSRKEYNKRCAELIKDMATAKYVFLDEATHITGRFNMRPETVVTQLWHGCGAFKKFGYSTESGNHGASKTAKTRYPAHKNYTHVTVSSPEVIPAYEEAMRYSHESGVVKALGISRTDVFYDEDFINNSYSELYRLLPSAKGKKIILYAPTFRGNVENAQAPAFLDLEMLSKLIKEDYFVIIKHHPLVKNRPEIPVHLQNIFAADFSDTLSIEQLLCVSDICISDYSSLIFEYSLFEKPMIFLAPDLNEYFDSRGFYYDYNELTPGPVVSDTKEVADCILSLEKSFDKACVSNFRNKFMSSCDGKATKRIIDTVFSEQYGKHRKEQPLPKKDYHSVPSAENSTDGK